MDFTNRLQNLDFSLKKHIMWEKVVESGRNAGIPGVHQLKDN